MVSIYNNDTTWPFVTRFLYFSPYLNLRPLISSLTFYKLKSILKCWDSYRTEYIFKRRTNGNFFHFCLKYLIKWKNWMLYFPLVITRQLISVQRNHRYWPTSTIPFYSSAAHRFTGSYLKVTKILQDSHLPPRAALKNEQNSPLLFFLSDNDSCAAQ